MKCIASFCQKQISKRSKVFNNTMDISLRRTDLRYGVKNWTADVRKVHCRCQSSHLQFLSWCVGLVFSYSTHACPVLQFLCCFVVGLFVLFYSRPFNAVLYFLSESVFLALFPFRTFLFITPTLFSRFRVVIVLVYFLRSWCNATKSACTNKT